MKEKMTIILSIGIVAAVLVTFGFFLANAGSIDLVEVLPIVIALILVLSASYILWDRIKNIRKGLPTQDERLKLINYKACSYGFIACIWSAVLSPLLSGILFDYEIPGRYVTAIVVLCGGVAFFISYIYLSLKGE